jgi:hypothetical protein
LLPLLPPVVEGWALLRPADLQDRAETLAFLL